MPLMIDATPLKNLLLALDIAGLAVTNSLDAALSDDPDLTDAALDLAESATAEYQVATNQLVALVRQLVADAEAGRNA